MLKNIDKLREFEDFQEKLLPALRGQLKAGVTSEQLYQLYAAVATARQITIALTEADPGKALSAIVDIQNRALGKPKEKLEVEHKYSKLTDDELDALLASRAKEVGEVSE